MVFFFFLLIKVDGFFLQIKEKIENNWILYKPVPKEDRSLYYWIRDKILKGHILWPFHCIS